jgi:hypothetical protein
MALRKSLIRRKPRSGCLEGRTAPVQPIESAVFNGSDTPRSTIYPAHRDLPKHLPIHIYLLVLIGGFRCAAPAL